VPDPAPEDNAVLTPDDSVRARDERVKRIVPWVLSFAIHGVLISLGFFVTWTVAWLTEDPDAILITADFDAVTYMPVEALPLERADATVEPMQNAVDVPTMDDLVENLRESIEVDPIELISSAASDAAPAPFALDPAPSGATFVGLTASNARRIVYVIDASGSMIRSWPIVLDELMRSLRGLSEEQSFGVVFFQRNEAIVVPPVGRLRTGGAAQPDLVRAWIDEQIIPQGRSNPMEAIDRALAYQPDVIFLLSENITGSGQFEIDRDDLLRLLDQRNPIDRKTGRRRTQINCIQFLDPDPLGTLERIAAEHGGPNGYKFLDRAELGLVAP
jgi:hypothetical protein